MTKRSIIWVVLFLLVVVGTIVAVVVFSNSTGLDISSSEASLVNKIYFRRENPYNATVNKDSKFKIYIDAGLAQGATSPDVAGLIIKYNPELLEALSITGNPNYISTNKKIDSVAGSISITVNSNAGFSIDKNIAIAEFKVRTAALNDVLITLEKGSYFGRPNTLDISASKIYVLTNSEFNCPQLTPPAPELCEHMEIFGGYSDRGCPLPPKCADAPTSYTSERFCTLEVRVCPDGSYVGRNAKNNCEFDACPATSTKPVLGCKADYNKDNRIDIKDFTEFVRSYKQQKITCSLDIIGNDCYLDARDLAEMAKAYKNNAACNFPISYFK